MEALVIVLLIVLGLVAVMLLGYYLIRRGVTDGMRDFEAWREKRQQ